MTVGIMMFGFLIGDYKSNGAGKTTATGVTLDPTTQAINRALLTHYNEVASQWQKGLSADQIKQVQTQHVDLPGAVLLGIGKMINGFDKDNADLYYSYLKPTYTWHTFTDITITHKQVQKQEGNGEVISYSVDEKQETPVTMLMTANTWDGTLTSTYRWVESGQINGPVTYTKKIVLDKSTRTYDWSRVWNLFAHVPAKEGVIQRTKLNQQTLAGLIAAVDYTIPDPDVQEMVTTILFPGGDLIGLNGSVETSNGNTIHDILRWKDYINACATKYQVPAVLIAGVMYQESNGLQTSKGKLVISDAGAVGLMQVEPSTASGMFLNGKQVGDSALAYLANPITNIELGSIYLSELYHQFGADPQETEGAYNAGPGAEQQAIAKGHKVPRIPETMNYVNKISNSWIPALKKYFGELAVPAPGSTSTTTNSTSNKT